MVRVVSAFTRCYGPLYFLFFVFETPLSLSSFGVVRESSYRIVVYLWGCNAVHLPFLYRKAVRDNRCGHTLHTLRVGLRCPGLRLQEARERLRDRRAKRVRSAAQ